MDFEERSGHRISSGEIVLFRTGAGRFYGLESYLKSGRGLSPDVIQVLVERGVKVIGTDAWSIDFPIGLMQKRLALIGPESVWEAHFSGRNLEFCTIEKLQNLNRLPVFGFWVACFPIKVLRGSAGWTRAVALIGD
jgi:kynurenine formamidase